MTATQILLIAGQLPESSFGKNQTRKKTKRTAAKKTVTMTKRTTTDTRSENGSPLHILTGALSRGRAIRDESAKPSGLGSAPPTLES